MNKNILLAAAIGITGVALLFVFLDSSEPENSISSSTNSASEHPATYGDNANVTYDTPSENQSAPSASPIAEDTKPVKKERERWLETRAFDNSGTFEIAIMNPNQDTSIPAKSYIDIAGVIDGKNFNLKVPDYLANQDPYTVTVRIRNMETNATESVPAYFLNSLSDATQRHFVSINSKDVQNIRHETKPRILPLPGTDEK